MKNNLIKLTYLFILTSLIFLFINSFVFAGQLDDNIVDVYNKSAATSDFGPKLLEIINTIRSWAFAIITLSTVATAILYITSSFNSDTRSWAKASIAGLIIGITILLLSNSIGKLMYGILTQNGQSLINSTADGSPREFGDITKFGNKITDIKITDSNQKDGSGSSSSGGSGSSGNSGNSSNSGNSDNPGNSDNSGNLSDPSNDPTVTNVNATNPSFQSFIGKPIKMTANAIQYYYENDQFKYLTNFQASDACKLIDPLKDSSWEWGQISLELHKIASKAESGPGIIPDYPTMPINATTVQRTYDLDDVNKFTTSQLKTAHDVICEVWFPNNKKPTIFSYAGRMAIKYNDTLEAQNAANGTGTGAGSGDYDPGVL